MKKTLRWLVILFMFGFFGNSFAQDCEIPGNFIQNPNFEHTMNPIFWYGSWDWVWWNNSVAWMPEFWLTDTTETHSGNVCMVITENSWVWPTVTTVGFEEQDMKMSFWYKSPIDDMAFWMFFYRDAGLSPADIRAPIPDAYIGYDTAYVTQQVEGDEVNDESLYFVMDGPYPEWTYFEFTFSYPGAGSFTTGNQWVTLMFWSQYTPGFVDDIYYGLDYECIYMGEEAIELQNPDFEKSTLGYDWNINASAWDNVVVLNSDENHTVNGSQSLRIWDQWNSTYYMPVMGTGGEDMDLSFWYKGHGGSVDLYFYDDFGLTTGEFPCPDGTELVALEYTTDTIEVEIDSTIVYDSTTVVSSDTAFNVIISPPQTVTFEDFEELEGGQPELFDWCWSGGDFFGYNAWGDFVVDDESYSGLESIWLPGDPGWTGAEGTLPGIEDGKAYSISFMYGGDLQFMLDIGGSLKYDLDTDPEGIVPDDATVDDGWIVWNLGSDYWNYFTFSWEVGTWLADSSVTQPAGLLFNMVGTYTEGDVGFVDDIDFAEVMIPVDVLAYEDFDTFTVTTPVPFDWNWSGGGYFGYNAWDEQAVTTESYSEPVSLWLPGDPGWSGAEGTIPGIVDSAAYSVSFKYKGKLQFMLDIGNSLKYDLDTDPESIMPEEAYVDEGWIVWELDSEGWKEFSFAWEQDSWLEDSAVPQPAGLLFDLVGTYTGGDNGYVDDFLVLKTKEQIGADPLVEDDLIIEEVYAIDEILYDTNYVTLTTSEEVIVPRDSDMEPMAIHWTLPAAADWTQFTYGWTNPAGDVGSTLTMVLKADEKTATDSIIYFDDFEYGVTTSVPKVTRPGEVHLYPNPVVDMLYLSIEDPILRVDIYNSIGQRVLSLDNPHRSFNVSGLRSGIYMLNVVDHNGYRYQSKFIKK